MAKVPYTKPSISVSDQVDQLRDRGMVINDKEIAESHIKHIGYYRLSGYWFPYKSRDIRKTKSNFIENTSFDKIIDHYIFDRKLRLITLDAIERIEVAFRAVISDTMSEKEGPHWYLDINMFSYSQSEHEELKTLIKRETKIEHHDEKQVPVFILHYRKKYNHPKYPPSWMVFECLSIGQVSRILSKINNSYLVYIAENFSVPKTLLTSWIHAISILRNFCAHHSRVWNRVFGINPKIRKEEKEHIISNNRFYVHALAIQIILKNIYRDTEWKENLERLFNEHPDIDIEKMGFPSSWQDHHTWSC